MQCACGCGEEFEPERRSQIYKDASHRQRDKNRRWPLERRKAFQVTLRDGHRERRQAQTSGVTPLLGTEMAQARRERARELNGKRESSEYLTSYQVADLLGLSPWALMVWRRLGHGPQFIRIGRNTIRYSKQELDAWLGSLPRN